jgi:DNA replication protein DnaC
LDNKDIIKQLAQSLRLSAFEAYKNYVKPNMTVEEALIVLMKHESEYRNENMINRRILNAGLPNGKTIDTFKFVPTIPHLKNEHVEPLISGQFIADGMNCCALGGSGTGKSHLMIAICREIIQKGYTASFMRVSDLITTLHEARMEKTLGNLMKKLLKVSLLCLDELGYINLKQAQAQLLFDVIAKRSEVGGSIFVTSNYEFSKWSSFLGDAILTKALVGKLAGNAIVLNMNGEDFRLASKKKK